jgi:colanic acid/amylovoran biosynthesis glycosyltransferase
MPPAQPFLVYRDRLGAPSEISFLRRQYVGFTRLQPIWVARAILPQAGEIAQQRLHLGGDGMLGPLRRLLFRHYGIVPPGIVPTGIAPPIDSTQGDTKEGELARVVHAQFARGGALALPLARTLQARLFVTLHGGDVAKRKNWQATVLARRWPAMIRETARFICVSEAVAQIAASHGAPPEKLMVLPIGVEIPTTPPEPRIEGGHLFVGRFVEKKGIRVLADAVRLMRAQGDSTPVTFVGDGPMRGVIEHLAHDVPGITLTGWLPPLAVQARMASAHTLVVPSIIAADGDAEGLPSVIPEAMAVGCVVIGSDQGGIAEAVGNDQTGLLVRPGDAPALAAAMRRTIVEPATWSRLSAAAFADVSQRLNARIQSARLEAVLLAD